MIPKGPFSAAMMFLWLSVSPLLGLSKNNPPPGPEPEETHSGGPFGLSAARSALHVVGKNLHFPRFHRRPSPTLHLPSAAPDAARAKPRAVRQDQVIQALTLDLPGGTCRRRRNGGCMTAPDICGPWATASFLCASGTPISLTDASLKLHPYIDVATPVLETEVSPDGRILVVEHQFERHTPEAAQQAGSSGGDSTENRPLPKTRRLRCWNIASREVLAALQTELPDSRAHHLERLCGRGKRQGGRPIPDSLHSL